MEQDVSSWLYKRVRFLSLFAISYQITYNSYHILIQAHSITKDFSFEGRISSLAGNLDFIFPQYLHATASVPTVFVHLFKPYMSIFDRQNLYHIETTNFGCAGKCSF